MPETPKKMPEKKLLDLLSDAIRTKHYSIRTEEAYVNWVRRFILFHGKRHPKEMGGPEIEAFLTHLAVEGHVSASTQNQALSALLFLYRTVLHQDLNYPIESVRAKPSQHLPEVLTKDEARQVIAQLSGIYQLQAKLLYGSGLRLLECLRLRVKDLDFERRAIIVRDTKGNEDRVTTSRRPCPIASLNRSRSTYCVSNAYTMRIWLKATAPSTSPMRWIGNTPMRPANGSGSMSSPPTVFRPILGVRTSSLPRRQRGRSGVGASAAITSTKAACSAPSARRPAPPACRNA